jgi:hypothetical protein
MLIRGERMLIHLVSPRKRGRFVVERGEFVVVPWAVQARLSPETFVKKMIINEIALNSPTQPRNEFAQP